MDQKSLLEDKLRTERIQPPEYESGALNVSYCAIRRFAAQEVPVLFAPKKVAGTRFELVVAAL